MQFLRHWSFLRVLLTAAAWVVLCVVLTIGWVWFQVRRQLAVSSSAGSGGIGAVSFGISLPLIGLALLPAILLVIVWLIVRWLGNSPAA
jgi:hypothetical protein